eukprot:751375-Hanusia_phi.AAC.2
MGGMPLYYGRAVSGGHVTKSLMPSEFRKVIPPSLRVILHPPNPRQFHPWTPRQLDPPTSHGNGLYA